MNQGKWKWSSPLTTDRAIHVPRAAKTSTGNTIRSHGHTRSSALAGAGAPPTGCETTMLPTPAVGTAAERGRSAVRG